MREIIKNNEPQSFSNWKNKRTCEWEPTYRTLQNPEKQDLQLALLAEQGDTCCYCGRKISILNSHIEHFIPQEVRKDLALSYSNLHASCIKEKDAGMPLHCGHAKGNKYCAQRSISPLEPGCSYRFIYIGQTGTVVPCELSDSSAKYMIETLNINVSSLKASRSEALKRVFNDDIELSIDDLKKLVESCKEVDTAVLFWDFPHVIARYAEQRIAEM